MSVFDNALPLVNRTDLDEAIAAFGFTRADLEAELDAMS